MAQLNVGGNFLAGLSGGLQAGQGIRQIQDQNALRAIGPDLMSGDPAALNKLAQIDPTAAMDLQRTRQADQMRQQEFGMNMQLSTARLEQIKAEGARAAAAEAARMTAEQKAAEAAKIDSALASASAAYQQGPDAFAAWTQANAAAIQESGLDPAQITHEAFPMIAAGLVGAREGLTAGAEFAEGLRPEQVAPMSPEGKLMADLQAGRITQEQFNAANQKSGMRVQSDGAGGFVFEQGPGVTGSAELGDISQPSSPQAMVASIDGILNDPAFDFATGFMAWTQNIPGTEARRFGARVNQLDGQAFLQAFESLKGGGQITEIEGQKATQAIARLDSAQRPEDYRQALEELKGILQIGMERKRTGGTITSDAPSVREVELNGTTYRVKRVD